MFCKNCGFKLEDNANFCEQCGTKVVVDTDATAPAAAPVEENFGTTPEGSLVCGSPAPAAEPVAQSEPAVASDRLVSGEPIVSQDTHEDSASNGPLFSASPAPETNTNSADATAAAAAFGASDTVESTPKKKNMKKILIPVIVIVVLIGLVMSLSGSKAPIVGKWYSQGALVEGEYLSLGGNLSYIEIDSDGTLYYVVGDNEYTGDWEYIEENEDGALYSVSLIPEDGGFMSGNIYDPLDEDDPTYIEGREVAFILVIEDITVAFSE